MNNLIKITGKIHSSIVHGRRIRKLHEHLARIIPEDTASLLDVGCGDGLLSSLLQKDRKDMTLTGIDVLVRQNPRINVQEFNGRQIPFPDKSFDSVMFIDVLHHADEPDILIAEAARVARKSIIIKDHVKHGKISEWILRFMDWVGNRSYGVALPYHYMKEKEMSALVSRHGLVEIERITKLGLYPVPATFIFDTRLHFISRFSVTDHGPGQIPDNIGD